MLRNRSPLLVRLLGNGLLTASALVAPLASTASPAAPSAWPRAPVAPSGAPNVLLIMTDDVGFGATSVYGGPVPTFAALARAGLRYNNFNSTALCSPSRASLLTGREPHNVNMGNVTNMPTGSEGYTTVIPKSAATIA